MAIRHRITDLIASERPQERLEQLGPGGLSDTELIAMILRKGTVETDVLTLSSRLLSEAGSIAGLMRWSAEDFRRICGIGKVKSLQLVAVGETARRMMLQGEPSDSAFDSPQRVFRYFQGITAGLSVEKFWILCLNRKNKLLRMATITTGTANSSLVHPREVYREAIRHGASAIIAIHNHPSGDPQPSRADIQVTRQLKQAAAIIGIDLLDHVVIGSCNEDPCGRGFYSFQESGLL